MNRRGFLQLGAKTGIGTAFMPLWMRLAGANAYAATTSGYKAIVCLTLHGGNDGNNMLVPLNSALYQQYATLRQGLALSQSVLHPVQCANTGATYGFHPALTNISSFFSQGYASVIANCGPMDQPLTKSLLKETPSLLPSLFGSHPVSIAQWESATTGASPTTGWGGRIADQVASLSGTLPPVISVSGVSTFTVGESTQSIAVLQSSPGGLPLPDALSDPTASVAGIDGESSNEFIQRAAQLRASTMQLEKILSASITQGATFKTVFPTTTLGQNFQSIAQAINGHSTAGASRQIFYANMGNFDTHGGQLQMHHDLLTDMDNSLGAFVNAMLEIGMLQNVLILTLSDFGRTMQSNSTAGSDHAWGNHQLILGGGFSGGKIIGSLPDFELGGSQDYNGQGTWIPTIASQQVAGNVASWFGLNSTQIASIFPNLAAFAATPISF